MHATTVAVDLAKEVFELAFADADYRIVQRKRLSRRTFAQTLGNCGPLHVVMEACGSAHYWARRFRAQGHNVRYCLPATYGLTCGATRPIEPMRPDCSKPIAVRRLTPCRSSRPSSRACRRCTGSANSSRRSAQPRQSAARRAA